MYTLILICELLRPYAYPAFRDDADGVDPAGEVVEDLGAARAASDGDRDGQAMTPRLDLGPAHDLADVQVAGGLEVARGVGDDPDRTGRERDRPELVDAVEVREAQADRPGPPGGEPLGVCDRGNPGMATGGTGDVLAGTLGGLLVQLRDLRQAARVGVLLHALAGDEAAKGGERGMVAGDLLPHLRAWANPT